MSVIVSIAAGIIAVSGALAAVGLNLPQIATHEHVAAHARMDAATIDDLRQYVAGVDLMTTQQAVESAELRALRLEGEIARQKVAGEDSTFNEAELRMLRKRVKGLDARAQDLLNPTE